MTFRDNEMSLMSQREQQPQSIVHFLQIPREPISQILKSLKWKQYSRSKHCHISILLWKKYLRGALHKKYYIAQLLSHNQDG